MDSMTACRAWALALLPAACGQGATAGPFATSVIEAEPSGSGGFGSESLPDVVLGPPEGGGEASGSTDVFSLGCGGSIVLGFLPRRIVDGPGPDLIVFENAFRPSSGPVFVEPGEVSVSRDGETWVAFPCVLTGESALEGCAGVTPVLASTSSGVDPTDPSAAGGDAFDLALVGLEWARYVRIVDRTAEYYGSGIWCTAPTGGFDLDAVAVVNGGS